MALNEDEESLAGFWKWKLILALQLSPNMCFSLTFRCFNPASWPMRASSCNLGDIGLSSTRQKNVLLSQDVTELEGSSISIVFPACETKLVSLDVDLHSRVARLSGRYVTLSDCSDGRLLYSGNMRRRVCAMLLGQTITFLPAPAFSLKRASLPL